MLFWQLWYWICNYISQQRGGKITVFEVTILTASLFVDRDAQIHTQPSPPSSRWLIQINAIIHLFKYKPNSGNVGTFFKIWIKWRLKYFQITWANILFTIEHREHNKCLNWEILHLYPLNELLSNLMTATGLKKVGTGWKSKKFWKDSAGRTSSN